MKNVLARIGRFFWSRGFLKFVLWTVTLIILFYAEEDWRGARAWAATKAKWAAQGESLDYFGPRFIPLAIPDSQNLAALPLFKVGTDPLNPKSNDQQPFALERALRINHFYSSAADLPPLIHWQVGELSDPHVLENAILREYAAAFKGAQSPPKPIDQFEALFPFLSELRTEAVTRPGFRLALDYSANPPDGRPLGSVADTIRLSKILTTHALLALDDHQSDLALDGLKLNLQIAAGIEHDPTIVAGLVAIGIINLGHGPLVTGLARHQWSDANLAELDHLLGSIDFLSGGQFAMRAEAAGTVADIEYYRHSKMNLYGLLQVMYNDGEDIRAPWWMVRLTPPWAAGWWDQNKCQTADSLLGSVAVLDPQNHRAYPEIATALEAKIDAAKRRPVAFAPWNIWATMAIGPMVPTLEKFAAAQAWLDEARIACALERYRLAHAVYPATLDALVPASIDELPHDVINGKPYRYRLQPDGFYLLYSVGWNQTDEGGKASYQYNNDDHQKAIDFDHGDWVWPTPKVSP